MVDTDRTRHELVNDLYIWGPALTSDLRARYPAPVIREMSLATVVARRKFIGFEVYLLSGKGLRSYGYSLRYNYVPARTTVLGALILRAKARDFRDDGYTVDPYQDYMKRGRGNIALVTKESVSSALIARPSLTLKALRMIAAHLVEQTPAVQDLKVFVLPGDYDPTLKNAQTVSGLPVTVCELQLSSVTRSAPKAAQTELETANG